MDEVKKILLEKFGAKDGQKMYDNYLDSHRHYKKGDNVVHVSFEAPAFTDDEVAEINAEFAKHDCQFSYVDESRVIKNHFDYHEIIANIVINQRLYELITNAIIYPVVWELMKALVSRIVKAKEYFKQKVKKETVCFTIRVKEKKTMFLLLDDNVQADDVGNVMDKALEFTKKEKEREGFNDDKHRSFYYTIDKDGNVKFME
jgi:hypothetical protein